MRATPDSPRMFDADWLDALSRTPWWTVPLLWVPISAGLFATALTRGAQPLGAAAATFAAGYLVWTLTEYALHRTVFHWVPRASWGPRFHFILHGVHHDWVFDRLRLVMPPSVSVLLGLVFGAAFRLVLGPQHWWAAFSGFTAGYLVYDVTHYAVHHLKLRGPVFAALKRHHLLHHHSPAHRGRKFGVSTTLWDHIFRTH